MKRWLPFAILGVGLVGVIALVLARPEVVPVAPEQNVPLVRVRTGEVRPFDFRVQAHGAVVPRTESALVPQVAGEIVWASPALVSGGFFSKDEPLVRIDRSDHEVALESARASLARARSENDRARTEISRQRQLAERDIASQARIDDAENARRVTTAGLREAQARLSRAERDIDRTELRAPYDGRVRSKSVDVGQFVSRGTPIATLYAVDHAEVRLPIPDRQLAYLDVSLSSSGDGDDGPEVSLRAEFAGRQHTWIGRIVRTEGEIDPESRMVNVVARVDDPYGRTNGDSDAPLAVGLFVDAEIQGKRIEEAVVLPRSALRDGSRVLVLGDAGRLHFREVDVLRAERDDVVIGSGLVAGERVCVSPLGAPIEGMRVRVIDEAEPVASTIR